MHTHPFYPNLQPVFSSELVDAAVQCPQDVRSLFHLLIHASENQAVLPLAYALIKKQLNAVQLPYPSQFIEQTNIELLQAHKQIHTAPLAVPLQNRTSLDICLLQMAPFQLTALCFLPNISQTATCDSPFSVTLLSLYRQWQTANTAVYPDGLYRALLMQSGLNVPSLYEHAFVEQNDIEDCCFEFALMQLALALFPRMFFAEILGFTLAYCQSEFLPAYLFSDTQLATFNVTFYQQQTCLAAQIPTLKHLISAYLQCFQEQKKTLSERIQNGFLLYQQQANSCLNSMQQKLNHPASIENILGKIISQKATAAVGHHRHIQLAGKPLDSWFAQTPFDSKKFLLALKQSPYIKQQQPEHSPLLKLFDFKGPMFGVLSSQEQNILQTWLKDKQIVHSPAHKSIDNKTKATAIRVLETKNSKPNINYQVLSNRELYYYLVNAERYPDVLSTAQNKVRRVLRTSRLFSHLPFKSYQYQRFENYFAQLYQAEMKAYQPLQGKPTLSKQAYIWGIEQFAPTILTDGCWLQGVTQLNACVKQSITDPLLHTYYDEIGQGVLAQNHPLIYRQLLQSLGFDLAPIHTQAFNQHTGFINRAFDLPVYLMAIGQSPKLFLPELLGLNLAIELSGLGKVYMRLSEALRYWKIDSHIVDIHISIDNVASGHAALAQQVIHNYLDEIAASQGKQEQHRHWARVYNGYHSLQTASRIFVVTLIYAWFSKGFVNK